MRIPSSCPPTTRRILFVIAALVILLGISNSFIHSPAISSRGTRYCDKNVQFQRNVATHDEFDEYSADENRRRQLLLSLGLIPAASLVEPAFAEPKGRQPLNFFVAKKNTTSAESFRTDPVDVETPSLSSELCLLRLLPVKNPVFKALSGDIQSLSSLRSESEFGMLRLENVFGMLSSLTHLISRHQTLTKRHGRTLIERCKAPCHY